MDEPKYKLLHSVDPAKIKVPLREKFSKLTLSSNKKKKDEVPQDEQQLEKRQSCSRNLMDELSLNNDDEEEGNEEPRIIIPAKEIYVNPLLRSDSTSGGVPSAEPEMEETQLNTMEDSLSHLHGLDHSEQMEPLRLSDDFSQQQEDADQQIDTLAQQISSLVVSSKPISISTTIEESESAAEVTQLVSTESQRLSTCLDLLQVPKSSKKTALAISISSDDDDSIISISDSAHSHVDSIVDFELVTSNMGRSAETGESFLPSTFSNEKADRMEAFLRDVSDEYKAMDSDPQRVGESEDNQLNRQQGPQIKKEILDTSTKVTKAQQLAAADTESMSPDEEEIVDTQSANPTERTNRQMALDDTIPISQTDSSLFAMESRHIRISEVRRSEYDNGSKRLAHNETEANTLISYGNVWNDSQDNSLTLNDSQLQNSSTHSASQEEDSIVIPETSTESDGTPSKKMVPSEQTTISSSGEDSPLRSQLSQIQMNMGSINISAKINIKIHISQQEVSDYDDDDGDEEASSSGEDDSGGSEPSCKNTSTQSKTDENSEEVDEHCKQRPQKSNDNQLDEITTEESSPPVEQDDQEPVEDANFLTHAEKLLNQLYGKSWKTPDVIRTLKRTSGSAGKSSNTKQQVPARGTLKTPKPIEVQQKQLKERPQSVEDSVLDDFSFFRHNIVKTNLDSTRLATPKGQGTSNKRTQSAKVTSKQELRNKENVFKVPQTDSKRRVVQTKRGRVVKNRWRQLVDSDSDGVNASDDEKADKTEIEGDFGDSDQSSHHSWSNSSNEDTDSGAKKSQTKSTRRKRQVRTKNDKLVYLDLSRDEVEVLQGTPTNPPANNDENFNTRLEDILRTCRPTDKPKLEATPQTAKPKRKLFTINFGDEDDPIAVETRPNTPKKNSFNRSSDNDDDDLLHDLENVHLNDRNLPGKFEIINKQLEAIKTGKPLFKLTPPRTTPAKKISKTPCDTETPLKTPKTTKKKTPIEQLSTPSTYKYGFLKSLDVCVSKTFCHPEALHYRENYRLKKEELSKKLYDLYNEKLFDNTLNVPLVWNKKLSNTAGRCLNKKKAGTRSSTIELSEKVLTSADRLRCTLIHELCHAATWVFNGEGGHGNTWKEWARKANCVFPEIPKIGVCHQYDIEYKYTYKCTLCAAKSHAHSKSKKVENIRCSYCHGAIEILLNKKDKDGNIVPTPVKEATGFAKFVKDNYKQHKRPDLKHADVMKILSNEFAALKVAGNAK